MLSEFFQEVRAPGNYGNCWHLFHIREILFDSALNRLLHDGLVYFAGGFCKVDLRARVEYVVTDH